jgi:PTH1 family peptidyl-tRNA hydrolase
VEHSRLIVGLGNPGAKYARTRHNVGFQLLEGLADKWRAGWSLDKSFQAAMARTERNGLAVWLCRPQTFMNASGEAVGAVSAFYRVAPGRMVVAVDDADLPLGEIRLRERGSSGGHHGLESIESHLGTRDYARLRIGIGRKAEGARDITDYVLAPFTAAEAALMGRVLAAAALQIECWLDHGIAKAMSQFNGVVDDSEQRKNTE